MLLGTPERRRQQAPFAVTGLGAASPGHLRSQVEPGAQPSEQVPAQVMWQVEPLTQLMLPLAPTVTVQVDPIPQATLHELPQVPLQVLPSVQLTLQLAPHMLSLKLHGVAPAQSQVVPLHIGGAVEEPHPAATSIRKRA
jgi:hypothetical protein